MVVVFVVDVCVEDNDVEVDEAASATSNIPKDKSEGRSHNRRIADGEKDGIIRMASLSSTRRAFVCGNEEDCCLSNSKIERTPNKFFLVAARVKDKVRNSSLRQ